MDLNKIKILIATGKLDEAVETTLAYAFSAGDKEFEESMVHFASRYNSFKKRITKGIKKNVETEEAILIKDFQATLETHFDPFDIDDWSEKIKEGKSETDSGKKTKVLFLSALPIDTVNLRIGDEYRNIKTRLKNSSTFELLNPELSLSAENLTLAMHQKPDILHFSGHGKLDGLLVQDRYEETIKIPPSALKRLFKRYKDTLDMIILNACYSADQAKALSELDIYCIGMSNAIEGDAAISFSAGLYSNMAGGAGFEDSFFNALFILETEHPGQAELPQLWYQGKIME